MSAASEAEQPPLSRIGVVIVARRETENLERCLESLNNAFPVLVVENGSAKTLGWETRFPSARFVRLPRNFGLTRALNIGIRAVEADFVLLLSPAVEIAPSAVRSLAETLESDAATGAISPRLFSRDGTPAPEVSKLPTSAQPDPPMEAAEGGERVSCVSGEAVMFRSFFLRALRQVDERYGDFGSHLELSRQILRSNKSILIHPTAAGTVHPEPPQSGAAEEADRDLGTSGFLMKHSGFVAGWVYLLKRIFAAMGGLRFKRAWLLITQTKIDGGA